MVKIDRVSSSPDRAGRYRVDFSDGSVMRLYRQTMEDFSLYTGMELDQESYVRLNTAAGEMSAKMRAVRIVSASNVSCNELRHRLIQKGEDVVQAENAVKWMSELSLVDDAKTAELIVQRCIAKSYGVARAKQMLYEKRIPKEFWEDALADYPDQTEKILDFLRSRLDENSDERDVRKATDALLRRGHSYQEIRKAMEQLTFDADFQEDF